MFVNQHGCVKMTSYSHDMTCSKHVNKFMCIFVCQIFWTAPVRCTCVYKMVSTLIKTMLFQFF